MGVDNFLTSCFFKFNFHATLQSEINAEAAGFSGIGFSRLIPADAVKTYWTAFALIRKLRKPMKELDMK